MVADEVAGDGRLVRVVNGDRPRTRWGRGR